MERSFYFLKNQLRKQHSEPVLQSKLVGAGRVMMTLPRALRWMRQTRRRSVGRDELDKRDERNERSVGGGKRDRRHRSSSRRRRGLWKVDLPGRRVNVSTV